MDFASKNQVQKPKKSINSFEKIEFVRFLMRLWCQLGSIFIPKKSKHRVLEVPGAVLGGSWAVMGVSWAVLGWSWSPLEPSSGVLWASWASLWVS